MKAANLAISSPLLEDASVKGARGVIINVTGGGDLSLIEVSEASAIIQEAAHEDANIIFGAVVDPKMEGRVKITVIATGFERISASTSSSTAVSVRTPAASAAETPVDLQSYAAWKQDAGERVAMPADRGWDSRAAPVLDLPLMASGAPARPSLAIRAPAPSSSRRRRSTFRRFSGGKAKADRQSLVASR